MHPDPGHDHTSVRRWAAACAERERLLRLSRTRTRNEQDAQDCVQEALLRCVEFPDLDERRIGAFLTAVTMRLCADQHRGEARREALRRRLSARPTAEPSPDEAVCDRAEAEWVAQRLRDLPARQQQVVAAYAAGLSAAETAERLKLSRTAVHSMLARARTSVRAALASTLAAVVPMRRLLVGTGSATSMAAAVAALVTTGPMLGPGSAPPAPGARPTLVEVERQRPVAGDVDDRGPAVSRALGAMRREPGRAGRPAPGGSPSPSPAPILSAGPVTAEDDDNGGQHYTTAQRVVHCVEHGVALRPTIQCHRPPEQDRHPVPRLRHQEES